MAYGRYPHDENEGLSPGTYGDDGNSWWKTWDPNAEGTTPDQTSESGRLGDDFGSGTFAVPGNLDKGALGGDNRTDLGLFSVRGNPDPSAEMGQKNYGWQGDAPLYAVRGNPDPSEVKSWFRGGSDALGGGR